MKIVGNTFWKWRTENRNRRREHDLRHVAGAGQPNCFQQCSAAVKVDLVAFFEVSLRLAGNDTGEMKNHVRSPGDCLVGRPGPRKIDGRRLHLAAKILGLLRCHNVNQCELSDRLAVERAVFHQSRREFAPNHSRGAGDQHMHGLLSSIAWLRGSSNRSMVRSAGYNSLQRQATSSAPTPPINTEATAPTRAARTPDSNSPRVFDEATNR